jgi:hypothetical protein
MGTNEDARKKKGLYCFLYYRRLMEYFAFFELQIGTDEGKCDNNAT